MTKTDEKKFDETLRRLMSAPPKPQEDMKKGRRVEKPLREMPPPPIGLSGPN